MTSQDAVSPDPGAGTPGGTDPGAATPATSPTAFTAGPRRPGIEVLLILGVSLGQSAIYSMLSIIEKLTRNVPLNQQTTSINNSVSATSAPRRTSRMCLTFSSDSSMMRFVSSSISRAVRSLCERILSSPPAAAKNGDRFDSR